MRPAYVAATVWHRVDYVQHAQSFTGTLPPAPTPERLVLLQRYDPGWRLKIAGRVVAPQKAHGLFNGWTVRRGEAALPYDVFYEPATSVTVANIAGNVPLVLAILWLGIAPLKKKLTVQAHKLEQVA
jgi:hypothetical protein